MSSQKERWESLKRVREAVQAGDIDSRAHHVFLTLNVYYTNGSSECWPTQETLAAATGLSRSTVKRALDDLERQRFVERQRGGSTRTRGNVYRLLDEPTTTPLSSSLKGPP